MSDRELWERGVATVSGEYARLSGRTLAALHAACTEIRSAKESLHRLFSGANGAELCRACDGACCARGKYHFTVVDLLVHLDAGRGLFVPLFDKDACPYLGEAGCFMHPPFRPYTCATFICDDVEQGLGMADRERFYRVAAELRAAYGDVEALFAGRFMYGLLINSERQLRSGGNGILGAGCGPEATI